MNSSWEESEDRSGGSRLGSLGAMWRLTRRRMRRPLFVPIPAELREDYRADRAREFRQRIGLVINALVAAVVAHILLSLGFPEQVDALPREALYLALISEFVIFLVSRQFAEFRILRLLAVLTLVVPLLMLMRFGVTEGSYFLILALAMGFLYPWDGIEGAIVALLPAAAFAFVRQGAPSDEVSTGEIVSFAISFAIIVSFQIERERERRLAYIVEAEADEARAEIEESLRLAARLHAEMLTTEVDTAALSHRIHYEPMQHLGGDFVKAAALPDGRVSFFIADVTGHGAPAALMINRINGIVERLMFEGRSPGEAVRELERVVARAFDGTGMLMSGLWAEYDPSRGEIRWVNRGHPAPFVLRGGSAVLERLKALGTLMGMGEAAGPETPESRIPISPGDLVLFFTDGLLEGERNGERFDMRRLEAIVEKIAALGSPDSAAELLRRIVARTREWRSDEARDDLLLAAWEFRVSR